MLRPVFACPLLWVAAKKLRFFVKNYVQWNPSLPEPRRNGNMSLAENVYSPNDPHFEYLCETETVCNEKSVGLLPFRWRQVSLFFTEL
jgi:hypothetical protein